MATEEEIKAAVDAATEGLKSKNSELLGKIKKLSEVADKVKDIDIDSLLAAKTELEDIKKKGDEEKGEYKKLYDTLKAEKDKETGKLVSDLSAAKETILAMNKKNAVVSAITSSGISIPAPLFEIAINNILPNIAVADTGKAMVGDKKVTDFVKEWAVSEVGKHFVVSGNSGGGANGGGGDGMNSEAKYFDKKSPDYNLTEQARLAKTNIELYNRLKRQYR